MPYVPPATPEPGVRAAPLCVDLRDALIPSSLSAEAFLGRMKQAPLALLWLERARSSKHGEVDVASLPYNRSLLNRLRCMKKEGRTLVLVADGDAHAARAVADHLGLFDHVIHGGRDAADLAAEMERRFGSPTFDFVGGVRRAEALRHLAGRTDAAPPDHPPVDLPVILSALRIHQWLKNTLVFLPVLAGQRFDDAATVGRAALAFAAFSFLASSVYVLNDLADLREDRNHATKRNRPFASGRLPISAAPLLLTVLLSGAALISIVALPASFSAVLGVYLALTLAYSLKFKGSALIDVFLLALLYTLRVIAGSAATGIQPSVWLLAFCMFFFLSLALVKRYAELHQVLTTGPVPARLPGRSYRAVDLPVLVALGVATGCISVLVLALYIVSDEFARHYSHPIVLWQLCPLMLYWVGRAWLVVARDEMHEDPLVWAVKDQLSRWVAIALVLILIFAR